MRVSGLAIISGLVLASHAVPTTAQRADSDIFPQSTALVDRGAVAQSKGDLDGAVGDFESALAVDPRNRAAFIALAQIARAQGMPGKAIGYYREALLIEPNDVAALTGQGLAMVDKGAIALAKTKLADARRLCKAKCPQVAALESAITSSEAKKLVTADAITPKPMVSTNAN